jgi:adenylate kinase
LLDGFPRTQSQAKALEEMGIILDMVISIEAAEDLLVARMTGRRICKDCAQTFDQASNPPQKEGVCDKCGGELIARSDDRSEVVRERLKVYAERTAPLKDYYRSKGVYQEVESRGTVEETFARIVKAIEKGES